MLRDKGEPTTPKPSNRPPNTGSSVQHKPNTIKIQVKVDTTELDVALDKARELQDIVNNMSGEDSTNGEKKDNPAKNIKTTLLPIGYINCNKINNLLYKMMKK